MSRVGKKPIKLPDGRQGRRPTRTGSSSRGRRASSRRPSIPGIAAAVEGDELVLTRADDSQGSRRPSTGCAGAWPRTPSSASPRASPNSWRSSGVGYKAKVDKNKLELSLGYSKPVVYDIPEDIEIVVEKPTLLTVRGIDKQRVGQVADEIKSFRKPDPYKQKGVRYVGEKLIKKERKAGVTGA